MRTFILINGAGETCNITDKQLFFHGPSGLGFKRTEKFRQVGDRFVLVNRKPSQGQIKGSVAFCSEDPYLAYYNFLQFLSREPLRLAYVPDNTKDPRIASGTTYMRNVTISSVEKTELEREGYLDCSITFNALTPWYKYMAISNGVIDDSDLLKWGVTWGYIEDDIYGIKWGPLDEFSRGIRSESITVSPARLTIYGPLTNPVWTHYVNGYVYETGKLTTSIESNEYLVVDNVSDPYSIKKYRGTDAAELGDLYQYSDFTTSRFINIQNGANTISVTDDEDRKPIVKLEAYIYYESV